MWPGVKSCCSPNGHCKTKTPVRQNSNRECKQIAFDRHKTLDVHVELPMIAVFTSDVPFRTVEPLECWRGTNPVEPSPPDLQLLNSTFLI
jgi:hypothetical protein